MRDIGVRSLRYTEMMAFLDETESAWILEQLRLRNALVHLGLHDIASNLGPGSTTDDAVHAYTDRPPKEVASRVLDHLIRFVNLLTAWMLSPDAQGNLFLAALRPAPVK
jgi:hypothetical protein